MPPSASAQADLLKTQGNTLFRAGDFSAAEQKYTAAITLNPANPLLYTNRALARLKLMRWEGVVDDCLLSLDLTNSGNDGNNSNSVDDKNRVNKNKPGNSAAKCVTGDNYKANYYLSQAQLSLHRPREALASALRAYDQVLRAAAAALTPQSAAANVGLISAFVVECKRARFAAAQRERARKRGELLGTVEVALEAQRRVQLADVETAVRDGRMGVVEGEEARREVLREWEERVGEVRTVFAVAGYEGGVVKEVPDHLVDTITFEIMHDPVITKTGHSYERATLLEHLKRSPTDPLTREPLTVGDLRPNVALRQVLEEFWRTAGDWAVEW